MPHDHPHGPSIDQKRLEKYKNMATAVSELLIEKSVISSKEINDTIQAMEGRGPALGARMVARAWLDPTYKAKLLSDGSAAAELLEIPVDGTRLIVVENTKEIYNLVVCTLCSCYPRNILGLPPRWYKSKPYRARAVKEPRNILREFGTEIPNTVTVRVHDSTADMRYMVLPERPSNTENWNEKDLIQLITRDSMIGVTPLLAPDK